MNITIQKAGMQETMRAMARKRRIRGLVRGQKGIALIEILAAIAILGVVAVAFLSALTAAYGAVIVADRHTRAESLTRTAFEYMRNLPYSSDFNLAYVALPSDNTFDPQNVHGNNWHPDADYGYPYWPSTDYAVHVTSTLHADNSTSPVKEITVAILYRDTAVDTTTTYRSDPNKGL
jgi:prepilin-type N-terminal cleavage/methylation domain-containing protein